jgi:hypothetical protein
VGTLVQCGIHPNGGRGDLSEEQARISDLELEMHLVIMMEAVESLLGDCEG